MTVTPEAPFSDLINKPKDTVAKLVATPRHKLRLKRRDDDDLLLTTVEQAEQEHRITSTTTKMFVALMRTDDRVRTLVTDIVPEVFPWVRFLSTEGVREFIVELVETMRAVDELDTIAAVDQVITEWRSTAEVQSDPELMRILAQPIEDFGAVPMPDDGE